MYFCLQILFSAVHKGVAAFSGRRAVSGSVGAFRCCCCTLCRFISGCFCGSGAGFSSAAVCALFSFHGFLRFFDELVRIVVVREILDRCVFPQRAHGIVIFGLNFLIGELLGEFVLDFVEALMMGSLFVLTEDDVVAIAGLDWFLGVFTGSSAKERRRIR